ncbi:MAG: hypothetical protein VKJ44_00285 [Synechococcus sp.]|nr:hypothetical protein [Synechococcus sp.]
MGRSLPWFWILLAALLLLLPGPAGRLLLDLLGGLTLTLLLLPLLAGAAGWIGWQLLRSRLRTCGSCGVSSFSQTTCPACGAPLSLSDGEAAAASVEDNGLDASQVTITVEAVAVEVLDPPLPAADAGDGQG